MNRGNIIIALDFPGKDETLSFLDRFGDRKLFVKVGMELFYAAGPDIVREIKKRGHRIFLDLKLHDIPNTVEKTMRVLSELDVDMTNLHAAGTSAMMRGAVRGLTGENGKRPVLLAVTQLTSTDQKALSDEILIKEDIGEVVERYAVNAKEAGLDGVVCSPLEAERIHRACGEDFLAVTPGIRFADGDEGDQKRVTTPGRARKLGSDFIVVGRPVTQAEDPVAAYDRCLKEWQEEE